MRHFSFYLRRSFANLVHNPQRTLFVLFSIAVGVAAVVSLRNVGLMIGEALVHNLQVDNRADVVVQIPPMGEGFATEVDPALVDEGNEHEPATFSEEGRLRLQSWARDRGYEITFAARQSPPASLFASDREDGAAVAAMTFFVEPDRYPLYGTPEILEPAGASLAAALSEPHAIVVTKRLATELGVGLGDRVDFRGPEPFVVSAILDDGSEARIREMEAVILPYALLRLDTGEALGSRPDVAYLGLPEPSGAGAVGEALAEAFTGLQVTSTDTLREQNRELSDLLTRLVTVMGLVALLIGGIGIVNTMLVVVGRRTVEIGVLKTLGLRGGQITTLFLVEALLLGIFGSLLGVAGGLAMVTLLQGVAERVVSQTVALQIHPEAILTGLGIGILVTLVFGFLPTLSAARVRPSVVLHPDRAGIARLGGWRSFLVVVALTGVLAWPVGRIVGSLAVGAELAYGAVAAIAVGTLLFSLLVRGLGRIPSPRNLTLRLVQRASSERPGRTASTLVALVVGMLSLSSILLLSGSLLRVIEDVLEERLGGDLIAVPRSPEASDRAERLLAELPGVASVRHSITYRARVVAVDGDREMAELRARAEAAGHEAKADEEDEELGEDVDFDPVRNAVGSFLEQLDVGRLADLEDGYEVAEGEPLAPGATDGLVLRANDATEWLGLGVGDRLTLSFGEGVERVVPIVGIVAKPDDDDFQVEVGSLPRAILGDDVVPADSIPEPTPFLVDLEEGQEASVMRALSAEEGVFVLEVAVLNRILTELFDQIAALPLVIAVLALFASGVILANTVSLAVLERSRQIGVMKAIGLQSRDVLRLLLLENGFVGLVGGLVGCGIAAAGVVSLGFLSASPGSFPFATFGLLVLLAVAVALVATLISAWGATREKPLIVLRTE